MSLNRLINLITFVILCNSYSSCKQQKEQSLDFCKMLADDQSFINYDKTDIDKYNSDRAQRIQIFTHNFNSLKTYIDKNNLSGLNIHSKGQDSCKYWASIATFIHMAQTKPTVFFNKENVEFFRYQISKGNLENNLLFPACTVSAESSFCETIKPSMLNALLVWELDSTIYNHTKFFKCE